MPTIFKVKTFCKMTVNVVKEPHPKKRNILKAMDDGHLKN